MPLATRPITSGWLAYTEGGNQWAEPIGECPLCVMKEAHRHFVQPDGSIGNVMERVEVAAIDRIERCP